MAIDFPSSPSNGQTLTVGDLTWSYNSTSQSWESVSLALDNSSDTQVLFNDGGVANGSSNLTFDKSVGDISVGRYVIVPSSGAFVGSSLIASASDPNPIQITHGNTNAILFATNGGTEHVRIENSGNVGIGTTSPVNKLEVYGSAAGEGITITNSNEPAAYKWKFSTVYDSSSPYRMYTVNDQILLAAGRLGDKVVFPSGNIGIGDGWLDANVPAAKLHVNGTSNITSTAVFGGTVTAQDKLVIGSDGGSDGQVSSINGGYLRLNASGGRILSLNTFMVANVSTNFGDMTFATQIDGGGSEVMRLSTTGNVGIGTASPTAKLQVAGKLVVSDGDGTEVTGGSSALQIVGGYSSPVAGRFIFGDGTGWQTHFSKYASSTLTDLFSFYDNGEFFLDGLNSGIIRLRNSPSVANTLDLHIRPDSGNSGYITFTEDAVADRWAVGVANGDSSLLFKSGYLNGTERMRIESSGNVGIGTSSPAYKLHVDGTINASSVLVNGSPIGGSSGAKIVLKPEAASFPTSNPAQYKAVSGTNFPVESLAFDDTTEESCYFKFDAVNYSSGNLTVTFKWYADTASTGGVVWEAALAAITPNSDTQDIETKAFATAQSVADSHLGTTGQRVHSVDLTLSNIDSLAADDVCFIKIARKPSDGSDTMTGDALLLGVQIAYS